MARTQVGMATGAGDLSGRPIAAGNAAAISEDSRDGGCRNTGDNDLATWRGNGDEADDWRSKSPPGARFLGAVLAQKGTQALGVVVSAPTPGLFLGKRMRSASRGLRASKLSSILARPINAQWQTRWPIRNGVT